jgi:hypothetical protein
MASAAGRRAPAQSAGEPRQCEVEAVPRVGERDAAAAASGVGVGSQPVDLSSCAPETATSTVDSQTGLRKISSS